MKTKFTLLAVAAVTLANCGNLTIADTGQIAKVDKRVDAQPQPVSESALVGTQPYVYVDGNGCEKWILDDGVEGYMTTRFVNDRPYCPDGNTPFTIKGDFRDNRFPG